MQYRKFGKLDWEVSVLGFGAMRLPIIDENMAKINEPEAIRMVRYAIDHGVNYVDSGYMYHMGNSERLLGKALKDGYRDRIRLATKLPAIMVESAADFDRIFNEQLERLQIEKVDFYLMHGLFSQSWAKIRDLGVLRWAEGQMARGRIGYLGFSFHDDFKVFKEIVDAYDNWTLAQILYNYMDEKYQAGRRGVEYATSKGLALVVMEPIRGGKLSKEPPESVAGIWRSAPRKLKPVEWALYWVWNQPEISVALSGMSRMEQVVENIAIAERARPGMLTAGELRLIGRVRKAYRALMPIPCTECKYCQPCPNGVDIPRILQMYNDALVYGDVRMARLMYGGGVVVKKEQRADRCLECEECLEKCPQKIAIPDWLKKAHEMFTSAPPPPK